MSKKSWLPRSLRWALAVLACYRLARLIAQEEGPGGAFETLRATLGAYDYGEDGEPLTNVGRGVRCALCVGMYAALLCAGLVRWPSRLGDALLAWLGVAGAQAILHEKTR